MNKKLIKLINHKRGFTPLDKESHLTGFTLVEIAIVLVIIGLLVGFGAGILGPLTKRAKYNETKETIDAAIESISSFTSSNNRIPTTSEFPTRVRTPTDSWAKNLYYIPDTNLDNLSAGGVCGRKTTGITLRDCTDAACTSYNDIQNTAFVIISGAENANIQTDNISGRVTVYEIETGSVDDYTTDMNRPESYDDIVKWVTLDELRIKAGCVGTPLKILNNELPYGFQSSAYSATVYADGGVTFTDGGDSGSVPDYEWCISTSAPGGLSYNCNGALSSSATCSLTAGTWNQCTSLAISGTPSASGSFSLTFFVRDNNDTSGTDDNITQKTLALTINPASSTGCSSYRVWNSTGSAYDFTVDSVCIGTINNNTEITSAINGYLNTSEQIDRDNNSNGTCQSAAASLTYTQAVTADTNADCCVNFTATDRTCP